MLLRNECLGCSLCVLAFLHCLFPLYWPLAAVPGLLLRWQLGYIPETMMVHNLPHLVITKGHGKQRRRVGETEFSSTSSYGGAFTLQEEQLEHYFRKGWVLLHDVLPPSTLQRMRSFLLEESGASKWPWSINGAFMYDELLDFYLFSPLGSIASQIFGGADTHFWSDFHYFRVPGQRISPWHVDEGECENKWLPANMTAESKVRMWITLDDGAPGPTLIEQDIANRLYDEEQRRKYWAGQISKSEGDRIQGETNHDLSYLAEVTANHTRDFPQVRLGDVLLHTPCLLHRSPEVREGRLVGFLCPTYHPAGSTTFYMESSPENAMRQCLSGIEMGGVALNSSCFPRVYPPPEELRHRDFEMAYGDSYGSTADWRHWVPGYAGRRIADAVTWGLASTENPNPSFAFLTAAKMINIFFPDIYYA